MTQWTYVGVGITLKCPQALEILKGASCFVLHGKKIKIGPNRIEFLRTLTVSVVPAKGGNADEYDRQSLEVDNQVLG